MCVVSMITDHYLAKWQQYPQRSVSWPAITPEEIAEFRQLLERAREYDKRMNQPDCEMAAKRERLLKLAKELGVEIDFV